PFAPQVPVAPLAPGSQSILDGYLSAAIWAGPFASHFTALAVSSRLFSFDANTRRRRKLAGQRTQAELQSCSSFERHNPSSIWNQLSGLGDRAKLIQGDLSCSFAIVSKAPPGLSSPTRTVEGRRCRANATLGCFATDGARAHHLRSRSPRLGSPVPAVTRP